MKKAKLPPIYYKQTPTRIRVFLNLRFKGDTYLLVEGKPIKELIIDEIKRQFSVKNPYFADMHGNSYDFPNRLDEKIKVSVHITENEGKAVTIYIADAKGICCVPFFPSWRRNKSKYILLFSGDIRTKRDFSAHEIGKIAVHELGHCMGINDLYEGLAPFAFQKRKKAPLTPEMPANDIMRSCHYDDWFTPNDLEMAILAFEENAPQTHQRLGLYKGLRHISKAIRYI